MFDALGRLAYTRRRWVLAAATAFLAVAIGWGTSVFGALSGGGFDDPSSESYRTSSLLEQRFGRDEADVVALYSSPDRTVDEPAYRGAVTAALDRLPRELVESVASYYSTNAPQLVSTDRRSTYAVIKLAGPDEDARETALEKIEPRLVAPGLSLQVGGDVAVGRDINTQVSEDIARAESLSSPILLVLLLVIFGSLAAAALPLAVGGLAILGAFTALRLLTLFTDVSVFAINIITLLGLGLAIDYALFIVSRFREELPRHGTVELALRRTMATAGRTVAFSGLTVGISLGSLLLFPQVFLRSMGFGGMAAVLVAMVSALTVLPALLAVLGHRVNSLSVRGLARRVLRRGVPTAPVVAPTGEAPGGAWSRVATSVMRRPLVYASVVVVLLLAMGSPFLRVQFGGVDARALPAGTESRQVAQALDRDFAPNATTAIEVAVTTRGPVGEPGNTAALDRYVDALTALPGVRQARTVAISGDTARVQVRYDADPQSESARELVGRVRALAPPERAEVLVGGQSAALVDLLRSLGRTLPWMALFVVVVSFVLLFFAFGSVVLPAKAMVMNTLSLAASFGALVWIFQDGHLATFLGFTPTGTVEATQPILMLAILFGLSMDYEVFLLSRVREQWDRTHDNTLSVATGLQRTGGIITSAALLLVIVIGAFSTSGIVFIKMIGVGMIIAILVDATVIRALLVPATMRLLGAANWWAPLPLRRIWDRLGLREGDVEPEPLPAGGG